jgi:hypothetical protein
MTTSSGGHLGLNPNGSTNSFAYWLSPDIAIEDAKIYRAQFQVGSSTTNADDSLQVRLRLNQKGSWQSWDRGVNSNNGQGPSAGSPKLYQVIFGPDVKGATDNQLVTSFDMLSFDAGDDITSWIYLEAMQLDEVGIAP